MDLWELNWVTFENQILGESSLIFYPQGFRRVEIFTFEDFQIQPSPIEFGNTLIASFVDLCTNINFSRLYTSILM